jgi:hypothetical protein
MTINLGLNLLLND